MDPNLTINDLLRSIFLQVSDLSEKGDLYLTIKDISLQETGLGLIRKPVLIFAEIDKMLILDRTNIVTIANLYGLNIIGWLGKRITLFATEVTFQGETKLDLRVRPRIPPLLTNLSIDYINGRIKKITS
jgi:hypothetical protein